MHAKFLFIFIIFIVSIVVHFHSINSVIFNGEKKKVTNWRLKRGKKEKKKEERGRERGRLTDIKKHFKRHTVCTILKQKFSFLEHGVRVCGNRLKDCAQHTLRWSVLTSNWWGMLQYNKWWWDHNIFVDGWAGACIPHSSPLQPNTYTH